MELLLKISPTQRMKDTTITSYKQSNKAIDDITVKIDRRLLITN